MVTVVCGTEFDTCMLDFVSLGCLTVVKPSEGDIPDLIFLELYKGELLILEKRSSGPNSGNPDTFSIKGEFTGSFLQLLHGCVGLLCIVSYLLWSLRVLTFVDVCLITTILKFNH